MRLKGQKLGPTVGTRIGGGDVAQAAAMPARIERLFAEGDSRLKMVGVGIDRPSPQPVGHGGGRETLNLEPGYQPIGLGPGVGRGDLVTQGMAEKVCPAQPLVAGGAGCNRLTVTAVKGLEHVTDTRFTHLDGLVAAVVHLAHLVLRGLPTLIHRESSFRFGRFALAKQPHPIRLGGAVRMGTLRFRESLKLMLSLGNKGVIIGPGLLGEQPFTLATADVGQVAAPIGNWLAGGDLSIAGDQHQPVVAGAAAE